MQSPHHDGVDTWILRDFVQVKIRKRSEPGEAGFDERLSVELHGGHWIVTVMAVAPRSPIMLTAQVPATCSSALDSIAAAA